MATYCTQAFQSQIAALGANSAEFVALFDDWKRQGEYGSYFFGKDGAYSGFRVDGVTVDFRHVHLLPVTDTIALKKWQLAWRRRSRKVSDKALVYSQDDRGNYLLIFILYEPTAHLIAQCRTQEHREIMQGFASAAEAFIFNGDIIA